MLPLRSLLLSLCLLAACAAPAATPVRTTLSPIPVPLATATALPTRPLPPAASPTPAAPLATLTAPLTPTLSFSLLNTWAVPPANDLAWLPDGQSLAVASAEGVYIYAADTLAEQRFLDTGAWVYRLAISPDGRTLAAATSGAGVQLWDLRRGRPIAARGAAHAVFKDQAGFTSLAFSPDGRRLALGQSGGVAIWDTTTGAVVRTAPQEAYLDTSNVQTVAFSHNGRYLAADSAHGLWLWEAESGRLVHRLEKQPAIIPVTRIAFSADDRVVIGASGAHISFWEVATGQLRRQRSLPGFSAVSLASDGLRLAGVGDGYLALSDAVAGQPHLRLMGHTGYASVLAYSPNSTRLAALDANATLWVWQVDIGRIVASLDRHAAWNTTPALSPAGQTLAWGSGHRVWRWDFTAGGPPRALFAQPDLVTSVAFSPDGRWLVTGGAAPLPRRAAGGATAAVRVWDLASGQLWRTLPSQGYAVAALAFSPDSQTLATGGEDTAIRLWEAPSFRLRRELTGYHTSLVDFAFSPDGQQLVALAAPWEGCYEACRPGYLPAREDPEFLRVWDVARGRVLQAIPTGRPACLFEMTALSSDGRHFAGTQCDRLSLWDLASGQGPTALRQAPPLSALDFSPDGRHLAGLSAGQLTLVDAQTGQVIASAHPAQPAAGASQPPAAPLTPLTWLTYLPNGRLLTWSDINGTLTLWLARLGSSP